MPVSIDISVPEGDLFYIPTSILRNTIGIRKFSDIKNVFAVIDSPSFKVNDETYPIDFQKEMLDLDTLDDFYYSLAKYYLLEEDIDNMEFIIKALGDLALYEKVQNCYSFIEKGGALNKITKLLEDRSARFAKGRTPVIETSNEPLCILEILQSIVQDKESELYWDTNIAYHRITQHTKSVEDHIIFTKQESGQIPVTSISIGSEKLNIGIKVRINGEVIDDVSGFRKNACIYRDFNIINSGNINVPYINARLSENLYSKFLGEGIIENQGQYSPDSIYTIKLTGTKSANKRVLKSMTMKHIAESLYTISNLKCKQWAINQLIKEVTANSDILSFSHISPEDQELMRILRIDQNGIYSPASIEKDDTSPFEIYPAMYFKWSIQKFPEKSTKERYLNELKESITNIKFTLGKDNKDIYAYLIDELCSVRSEMRNLEFKVNSVRIASAITNKSPFMWEETGEKSKICTDKILARNMVVGGKLNYCRKTVDGIVIEQQKWIQLIKCN